MFASSQFYVLKKVLDQVDAVTSGSGKKGKGKGKGTKGYGKWNAQRIVGSTPYTEDALGSLFPD